MPGVASSVSSESVLGKSLSEIHGEIVLHGSSNAVGEAKVFEENLQVGIKM